LFQVAFKEELAVEGITIYNARETELSLTLELMKYISFSQNTFILHAKDNDGAYIFNKV
jgi:hypothetical protein